MLISSSDIVTFSALAPVNVEVNFLKLLQHSLIQKRHRWSRGERAGLCYPSSRVQIRPKPSDFSGENIPQHAFIRRGSKAVGPMS